MITRCTRCIYDTTIPGITFDADGVCNYCRLHDDMDAAYPTGEAGRDILRAAAQSIKEAQKDREFDCVAGLSGGCDSSYTLYQAVKLGLRPIAVHFDNGWNTDIAEHNIEVMTKALDVPLVRHKVDQPEFDSINMAFLRSGVPDFEAPTDIALPTVAYRVAEQHGVKYMLNGHSFRTEGVTPLGWSYMDGRYIADVCARHGGPAEFVTYPNLWFKDFVRWSMQGYHRLRPLYYIDYQWDEAKQELSDKFGWQWYGTKHGESEITVFFSWLMRVRWNINLYTVRLAALVRSGQRDRAAALAELEKSPEIDADLLERICARFARGDGCSHTWFLNVPKHSVDEYKTYRPWFNALRPFWWAMMKTNRIPKSFYLKYCKPGGS